MLTKKYYELVAAVVFDTRPIGDKGATTEGREMQRAYMARHLADAFADDNPKFDRARFLKACGVQS